MTLIRRTKMWVKSSGFPLKIVKKQGLKITQHLLPKLVLLVPNVGKYRGTLGLDRHQAAMSWV